MLRLPLHRWLGRDATRVSPLRRARCKAILIERLEDRCVPVVGFSSLANEVGRGGGLDGVVLVGQGEAYGSGALLSTSRHVLTAAHVVGDGSGSTITFQLNRDSTSIDIVLEIPASSTLLHSSWAPGGAANQGNDLALLTLIDQIDKQVNRQLIAPFGAERYSLWLGDVAGEIATLVGYGRTGTGTTGNYLDEVQQVRLSSVLDDGTFTLTFKGETTAPLSHRATRAQVEQALAALPSIGTDATGRPNVEVSDRDLQAGAWDIRFLRDLGSQDVESLSGTSSGGDTVEVTEAFAGGSSEMARIKREGRNEIDRVDGQFLSFDFDDGSDAHNSMGSTGLGESEAGLERGDSGSPLLIESGGAYAIAGVFSYIATGGAKDANNFATADGSFGGTGTYVSTASHQSDFLDSGLAGDYHLVLDMQQQVLGLDGIHEALTIHAWRDGGDLVISVFGSSDPRFNGEYYRAPINQAGSRLLSLTLRGTDDDETFLIDGDLGLGSVTIDGRGGHNSLRVGNDQTNFWQLTGTNAGTVDTNAIAFSSIEDVQGGDAADQFAFSGNGRLTGNLDGGGGSDRLDYRAFGSAVGIRLMPWMETSSYGLATAIGGAFSAVEGVLGSGVVDRLQAADGVNSWTLTGDSSGSVNGFAFWAVEQLGGGDGDDTFVLTPAARVAHIDGGAGLDALSYAAFRTPVTVNLQLASSYGVTRFDNIERVVGGAARDAIVARNSVNYWDISATNAGTINGAFEFAGFERLCGGITSDLFAFGPAGRVTDLVIGSGGWDWLDYRGVSGGVLVDLGKRIATRTNGILSVENVLGSYSGRNRLLGDATHNILVAYGAGNNIQGGSGRDFLVGGGAGSNYVVGGAGDDIAVAYSITLDQDIVGMQSLMAEWVRPIAYSARVNNLIYGRGLTGGRRLVVTTAVVNPTPTVQHDYTMTAAPPRKTITVVQPSRLRGTVYGSQGQDFFAVRNATLVRDLDRRRERVV